MIYVTGDLHGSISRMRAYKEQICGDGNVLVALGDWGIVFGDYQDDETVAALDELSSMNLTMVAILGNHDDYNWAENLPKVRKYNADMRKCVYAGKEYPNIFIVDEITVADIQGEHCLLIPHAESNDVAEDVSMSTGLTVIDLDVPEDIEKAKKSNRFYRVLGKSWWPQEKIDIEEASRYLEKENRMSAHYDLILSHDFPASFYNVYCSMRAMFRIEASEGEFFLEGLRKTLDFDNWFFGHAHLDMAAVREDERCVCLYRNIVRIGGAEKWERLWLCWG